MRDVERTLGKGSLRLLANIPDGYMERWPVLRTKLARFISTKDLQMRVRLQEELADLLPTSERGLYNRRVSMVPEEGRERE